MLNEPVPALLGVQHTLDVNRCVGYQMDRNGGGETTDLWAKQFSERIAENWLSGSDDQIEIAL